MSLSEESCCCYDDHHSIIVSIEKVTSSQKWFERETLRKKFRERVRERERERSLVVVMMMMTTTAHSLYTKSDQQPQKFLREKKL